MKNALRSGALLALVGIIITIGLYIVDATLLINMWYGLTMLVVFLGLVIYFGINYRKNEKGNILSFKDAYLHGLVTLIVTGAISTIFSLVLYNVIDPELPAVLEEATIQQSYEMIQKFGAPSGVVDAQMAEVKKSASEQFTFSGLLKGYGIACVVYLVVALITGAIVKRKEPEFE